jgi:hypothetical protein
MTQPERFWEKIVGGIEKWVKIAENLTRWYNY